MDGDTSPLNAAARALLQVQHLYGVIPSIKSKGAAARKVLQKLFHLRRESEAQGAAARAAAVTYRAFRGAATARRTALLTR